MQMRFWGTRGSIATPGPKTVRYGGNTPCAEARLDDGSILVFDCGTGARELGLSLAREGPARVHLFVGHTHSDHIQGLPFFAPAFMPGSHITLYGPSGVERNFPNVIGGQWDYAYFPVPIQELPATLEFVELGEGEFSVGRARVRTQYLNHTSPCLGYRVEVGGTALVYATDHEPHAVPYWRPDRAAGSYAAADLLHPMDARHAAFLEGADLVIHDTQYTLAEYPQKVGWGHSPVEYALDLALAARVKRLALFHYDPTRDDAAVDALLRDSQGYVAAAGRGLEVFAAAEGLAYDLPEAQPDDQMELAPPAATVPSEVWVLIADDDDVVARMLELTLRRDGYQTVRAHNGREAVQLAEAQPFDLILLDVDMPHQDGLETCRQLRADSHYQDVPIVMLTGRTEEADLQRGFAEGVTDYMTKPFASSQLRSRVQSWLVRLAAAQR